MKSTNPILTQLSKSPNCLSGTKLGIVMVSPKNGRAYGFFLGDDIPKEAYNNLSNEDKQIIDKYNREG